MKTLFGLILIFLFYRSLDAQNTFLDPTFGNGGLVVSEFLGDAKCVALQDDGKIVVAGTSQYGLAVLRYNSDGALDFTWGAEGKVFTSFESMVTPYAVEVQSDRKILVLCTINTSYDNDDILLVRYTDDGILDLSFGTDGMVITSFGGDNDRARAMALQKDGKIVVVGSVENDKMLNELTVLRYTANGMLDKSFNGMGMNRLVLPGFGSGGVSVMLTSTEQIICAGYWMKSASDPQNFLLTRFGSNGSLDKSFGVNGFANLGFNTSNYSLSDMKLQSDGKIVISGSEKNDFYDFFVARYNSNGTLDKSFGDSGKAVFPIGPRIDACLSLAVGSHDELVLGGWTNLHEIGYPDFATIVLHTNGSPNTFYNNTGIITTDFGHNESINDVMLQPDGKIIAAGVMYDSLWDVNHKSYFALARYEANAIGFAEESLSENAFSCFPNPASKEICIKYTGEQETDVLIMVFDALGKCDQSVKKRFTKSNNTYTLDLEGLVPGLYSVRITSGGNTVVKKVTIQ